MSDSDKHDDGGPASEKTLADYFAGLAMLEMVNRAFDDGLSFQEISHDCYLLADAMIARPRPATGVVCCAMGAVAIAEGSGSRRPAAGRNGDASLS